MIKEKGKKIDRIGKEGYTVVRFDHKEDDEEEVDDERFSY